MSPAVLSREDLRLAVVSHLLAQTALREADEERARLALVATDARAALRAELEARGLTQAVVAGHLVELTDRSVQVTPVEVLP